MSCSTWRCAEQPWGTIGTLTLPSGTELGVYEPKHESPLPGVGA